MEKVSRRKQLLIDAMDAEIEELEEKLAKVQPIIDELNQIKRARATLLAERTTTGSVGRRSQLTMETVIHAFREHGPMTATELAERTGVSDSITRSHLNRYRDQRYAQDNNGTGIWRLIGEEAVEA